MKQDEGLYRAARLIRRLIVGVVTLVVVVAVVGYLFVMRQVDPNSAWAYARRELATGGLQFGERPMRIARVYIRRPANYFRAASGLLVATPDRVLFIGLEPRDKLAGADAPAAVLSTEFRDDTLLTLTPRRLYAMTAHGVTLSRADRSQSYAAASGYQDELDSLVAYVASHQRDQRELAARDRTLKEQLAELLKQPLHYVVERGDAISTIAARYGATPAQIREWNHLPSDRVRIGATLLVRPGR